MGYNIGLSRSVAQSGSAPGLGPGGPRFESLYSDQKISKGQQQLFAVDPFFVLFGDFWYWMVCPTGFEPVMFHWKTDYESGAFNHSATNANMELMGIEPTSI